jgi:hypothetical protein
VDVWDGIVGRLGAPVDASQAPQTPLFMDNGFLDRVVGYHYSIAETLFRFGEGIGRRNRVSRNTAPML